jgi:hypothetical protein
MVGIKPKTTLQMIAVQDIGKYGLWAFEKHDELNCRAIDIAGDALPMPEAAKIIVAAAGRTVEFEQTPIEEVRRFSADFAIMLEWFDRVGYNADIGHNEKESAIRPTPFAEWVKTVEW